MIGELKAWLSEFIDDIISGNLKSLGYSIGKQLGAKAIDLLKAAFSGAAALALKAVSETLKNSGKLTSLFGSKITNRDGKKQCADILGGLCFGAGTPVLTSIGYIPIEEFPSKLLSNSGLDGLATFTADTDPTAFALGKFGRKVIQHTCNIEACTEHMPNEPLVWTYSPNNLAVINGEQDTEEITPEGWKWVKLKMVNSADAKSETLLRRPNTWLEEHGVDQIGKRSLLSEQEINLWGVAEVIDIYPNTLDTRLLPEIRSGDFILRPISGFFSHQTQQVEQLFFSESKKPLSVTHNHPLYSLDRHAFVPAGMIRIGERLKTMQGEVRLLRRVVEEKRYQAVYNIEVWRGSNLLIGENLILALEPCHVPFGDADFDKMKAPWAGQLRGPKTELIKIDRQNPELSRLLELKRKMFADGQNVASVNIKKMEPALGSRTRYEAASGHPDDRSKREIKTPDGCPGLREGQPSRYMSQTFNCDKFGNPCNRSDDDCYTRSNDSEVKILEQLAKDIDEAASAKNKSVEEFIGEIELVTELFPCKSCAEIIKSFQGRYKGVKIKILSLPKTTGAR